MQVYQFIRSLQCSENTTMEWVSELFPKLTQSCVDVLLSSIHFREKLFEEFQPSFKPQQRLSGRVSHLGHLHLHFVQHNAL